MASHPSAVTVVEVGPRDGLQNEAATISIDDKVAFIDRLTASGLRKIEVSAFVSPKWIPQLADASEVFARISRAPQVRYSALVPNMAARRAIRLTYRFPQPLPPLSASGPHRAHFLPERRRSPA